MAQTEKKESHFFAVPIRVSRRSAGHLKQTLADTETDYATTDYESQSEPENAPNDPSVYARSNESSRLPSRSRVSSRYNSAKEPNRVGRRDLNLNLKQKHFIVLNTVLHRCLQKGDYVRAGRAYGMLMRSLFRSNFVNIRQHGMWGIGSEILLRGGNKVDSLSTIDNERGREMEMSEDEGNEGEDSVNFRPIATDTLPLSSDSPFSEAGFEAAKAYYERLILQFPYHKFRGSRDISALQLYPAMIGLWIHQIDRRSAAARARTSARLGDERLHSDVARTPGTNARDNTPVDAETDLETLVQTLASAREIQTRLETVTLTPPYDRDPPMQKLRGMVALWMTDLILEIAALRRQVRNGSEAARSWTSREELEIQDPNPDTHAYYHEAMQMDATSDQPAAAVRKWAALDDEEREEILLLRARARDSFVVARLIYPGIWDGDGVEAGPGGESEPPI